MTSSWSVSAQARMLVIGARSWWAASSRKRRVRASDSRASSAAVAIAAAKRAVASSARCRSVKSWTKALNVQAPSWSVSQTVSTAGKRVPSRRTATSSADPARSVWTSAPGGRSASSPALTSAGMSAWSQRRPTTSSRGHPNICSAEGFQSMMAPPWSTTRNASFAVSRILRVRSPWRSLSARADLASATAPSSVSSMSS